MLEIVSGILRAYHRDHGLTRSPSDGHPPVRTALLHPYIEERGVVDKIYIHELHMDSKYIVATVQKFRGHSNIYSGIENHAIIYYAQNQNICWRRFGVCKEMYHCMIDRQESDRVATLDSLKNLLELLVADTTPLTGTFAPLDKEQQAELLALETLFPVEFREAYREDIASGKVSHLEVAEKFKIPEVYVEIAYQSHYYDATKALRGKLLSLN